mmetsp:Transcript_25090/g.59604  ORF Transcript_25090/g.59604 Transcript_25090/m.59604 type:complete len:271 (+) Transcript_25090:165-977(+)|eukprot:CAMPEP_0113483706 /NCGR_PEP_ID=MMETSP0014_2-20120614/23572_1 /TAXON_ID=2857 /ORGANISM="Nitzschia sp." /LENGTH=270 /DNA_ID=CAMNT_0000377261 /DNA_START=114 /DNA_END=926 /DNA_ORIENTATION=- /assembly_acc=CAM_ASM_000159
MKNVTFCCSAILVALASTTSAFAPAASLHRATKTALNVASTPGDFQNPKDDWSNKPLHTPTSTTPVADKKVSKWERSMMPNFVVSPDYTLTWAVALLGPLIMWYHPSYMADGSPSLIGVFGCGFHLLFATLLGVQTARVRLVFEKDGFEFFNVKGPGLDYEGGKAELVRKPDNYVAGTHNRWKYDSIINYGFFPSEDFPVICYFKETQTPEWKWSRWFAAFDSYGRGQPHFFPGICNVHEIKKQFEARGVKRKPIPSFKSTAEAKNTEKK